MSGFGPPNTTAGGFNFSSISSTAAKTNSASGFGAQATPALPQSGGLVFGSQTAPTTSTGFGLTQQPSSGFNFAPAPAAVGQQQQPPAFGAPTAAVIPQPSTGFALPNTTGQNPPPFGAAITAPAVSSVGLTYSTTPATAVATGFSGFGLTAPKTTAGTGFNFSTPTSAATSGAFNLGVNPTTSTAAPLTAFSLGTSNVGLTPQQSAPAASGLSFGAASTAPTTTPALSGFNLGGPGGGLFGKPAQVTSVSSTFPQLGGFGIGAVAQTTAAISAPATTASIGLGGFDVVHSSQPKLNEGKLDNVKAKETQVPEEIIKTVENLKEHIKREKKFSSDINTTSSSKLFGVSKELEKLNWTLKEIANMVEKNYVQTKLLRNETSRQIQYVEMAQRTHDTPAGLQFENTVPFQYFVELVQKYEQDLIVFRHQVEETEKHMMSLSNPESFTPEDLKRGMQQIHESFIALAGRLHEIHQKVETQKEQYLNLRKYFFRDQPTDRNVFEEAENNEAAEKLLGNVSKISSGPTPFSTLMMGAHNLGSSANRTATQNQANAWGGRSGNQSTISSGVGNSNYGFGGGPQSQQPQQSFFGLNASTAPYNQSMLGSSGFGSAGIAGGGGFLSTTGGDSFNLQKPPIGAKRNKQ